MLAALNRNPNASPEELLHTLRKEIDVFVGDAPQFDDITMLSFCYFGPQNAKELKLEAVDENLGRVLDFVNSELDNLNCPEKMKTKIDVALEEIFVNISHYAYKPDNGTALIRIEALSNPKRVKITLCDWGVPYDPLAKKDPDITLSAQERQIGGLGVYIVKKYMDDIKYEYIDGQNVLTIVKNLESIL